MRGIRQHGIGRSLYEECMDGVGALAAAGFQGDERRLLAFFPYARRNPFQRMLYARGFDHGFACFPMRALGDIDDLPTNVNLLLHYHWLHRVFDETGGSKAAKKAARHFVDKLKRQRDNGHKVVWTVHNILSHGAAFPEEEKALRASVAEVADVVHVMNPQTADLCSEVFTLDKKKVITVPHPSYRGVYGDYVCAKQARFNLDLKAEDRVFLLFGSLGPHKGTRQFLGVFDELQTSLEGKARVVIAGAPGESSFMEEIQALTAGRSDVQLFQSHVDDQAVQTFFRAADVVVCPYPIGLNSGVMATALTFARPVVVPDIMANSCAGAEAGIVGFKVGDMAGCMEACMQALEMSGSAESAHMMQAWSKEHAPVRVSDKFFTALRERLGRE